MYKYFIVAILFFPTFIAANEAAPIKQSYEATLVADDTYVIHGPLGLPSPSNQGFMNNPAFMVLEEGVVVVDPGSSLQVGNMLIEHIRKKTKKPVIAVFNTHVHGDHWLANDALARVYPEAKIYAHPNTIKHITHDDAGEEWLKLMMDLTEKATDGTKIVPASIVLTEGDKVTIGSEVFQVLDTELAHTDGDIMIMAESRKILFGGDNICNNRIVRNTTIKGNILGLQRAMEMDIAIVVPGHGMTGGKEVLANYLEYLTTVYDGVKYYYTEEDLSDFEIKPLLSKKMTKWENWSGFDEEFGVHVNRAYLEIEAEDF